MPKKISLVSGNRPGEIFFIIHPPAQSNVYQNIYFYFQKKKNTKKQEDKKIKGTKEEKTISVENPTEYDDIVREFALCNFNLPD